MKLNAIVAGVGMTPFGKHLDTGLKALGAEAVRQAVADADIGLDSLEAAWVGNALPGIVIAFLISSSRASWPMFLGALIAGLFTTLLIELIHSRSRIMQDAAIGITFSTMFAIGVILVSAFAGHIVRVRFYLETFDAMNNGFPGWFVDDVRVTAAEPEHDGIGRVHEHPAILRRQIDHELRCDTAPTQHERVDRHAVRVGRRDLSQLHHSTRAVRRPVATE